MSVLAHSTIVGSTVWQTEADTRAFASKLASALLGLTEPGHALITLHGDLGAGKTTLVRHLLHALGVRGRIKSPTYGLVESYEAEIESARLPIWHMDFYRFGDPAEWEHAGLRDIFASRGLKLVEWPERAADRLPLPDLSLRITSAGHSHHEDSRQVQMEGCGPSGRSLIEALA